MGGNDGRGESVSGLNMYGWVLLLAVCVLGSGSAQALSMADAIAFARRSDPGYLAAQSGLEAARQRSRQAVANLLPQVSITANTTANRRNYDATESPFPPTRERYNSNAVQLSVTQSLWRRANHIAVTQTEAAVAQADHQRAAAEQDLLVRLAQAWFDVMLSRDAVVFADGQATAARHEWEQTRQAVQVGLASYPMLEETRAKFDQAIADQVVAQTEQDIKLAALEQIVGPLSSFDPPSLSDGYIISDLRSGALEQWLDRALSTNPSVLATQSALDAAGDEVRKHRAGHEPTIDIVANYGNNGQGTGTFPGQSGYDIRQRSIGLQLNVPIFSGGAQGAKVDEAIAMREKVFHDLELARRNVRLAVKQAWFGWDAGAARTGAALQMVKSSSLALKAAVAGRVNDLKAELDVLQARRHLYGALRDLQKARYDMITNHIKLKAAAGQLADADLLLFDAWFVRRDGTSVRSGSPSRSEVATR